MGFGSSTSRNLVPNILYNSIEKELIDKPDDKTKIKKPFTKTDRLIFATSSNKNT